MPESCPKCLGTHRDDDTCPGRPAPPIGEVFGEKYRVTRLLGHGGMGAVYEAQHVVVGRRFAIKLLHPEVAGQRDMLTRFQREAQTAGSLESENIAAVVDFGQAPGGAPYIVMELLQGEDLGSLLAREGPLPVPRVVGLIIQACRGLQLAHARGIVHRDLKPENLFVSRRADGTELVKLLDFGIAKLLSQDPKEVSFTRTGTAMGTPFYMPPEQARGAKSIDHRADLYALGVILYELLSGAKPHPGESYNEILSNILTTEPIPLEQLRSELPRPLTAAIHRLLSKDPAARQQSVAELVDGLVPFAGRAVTPLTSGGPDRSAPVGETGFANTRLSAERIAPRPHRLPIYAALGVLGIAGAGVVAWRASRPPVAAPAHAAIRPVPPTLVAPTLVAVLPTEAPGRDAGVKLQSAGPPVVAIPAKTTKPSKKVKIDADDPYAQ